MAEKGFELGWLSYPSTHGCRQQQQLHQNLPDWSVTSKVNSTSHLVRIVIMKTENAS